MITARFYENPYHIPYGCRITGHAEFAESGRDIICAGISALAVTTANSIEQLTDDAVEADISNGNASIFVTSLKKAREPDEASLLLNALKLGVTNIRDSYGSQYVRVEVISDEGGISS